MSAIIAVPAAKELGGALVRIMADRKEIARYAAGAIDEETELAVTKMVVDNPDLNTENRIGAMLWLASFHGEVIDLWLIELNREYKSEDVLLVIDFLYEIAVRTGKGSLDETSNDDSRQSVSYLLEFLEIYAQLDDQPDIHTTERLSDLVDKLGGLDAVLDIDTRDALEAKLFDTEE